MQQDDTPKKRYRLEKLIGVDTSNGMETWKRTKFMSDDVETLKIFMAQGYRIFDCVDNKEIIRNGKYNKT